MAQYVRVHLERIQQRSQALLRGPGSFKWSFRDEQPALRPRPRLSHLQSIHAQLSVDAIGYRASTGLGQRRHVGHGVSPIGAAVLLGLLEGGA